MTTVNDMETREERNWGAEPWRRPTIQDNDELIYSECGRIMDKVDYRSHWFCIVKPKYGGPCLLVKHGAGEEHINLGWSKRTISSLALLGSDDRYFLMHTLHKVHGEAKRAGMDETATKYKRAFVDGRLMKRKLRGQDAVKVWIDQEPRPEEKVVGSAWRGDTPRPCSSPP